MSWRRFVHSSSCGNPRSKRRTAFLVCPRPLFAGTVRAFFREKTMKNIRMSVVLAVLFFPAVSPADDLQFASSAAINFKTGEYVPRNDPDTGFKFKNTTLDLGFTVFTSR